MTAALPWLAAIVVWSVALTLISEAQDRGHILIAISIWLAAIVVILVLLAGAVRLRDSTDRSDEHEEGL